MSKIAGFFAWVLVFLNQAVSVAGAASVYMTNITFAGNGTQGVTVGFDIAGGTNNLLYDILRATDINSTNTATAHWTWIGQGYPTSNYVFTGQDDARGFFALRAPRIPAGGKLYLTNVTCSSAAISFAIAGGTNGLIYDVLSATNLTG